MSKIAFIGLGAMGVRMAARLLGAGHELTVWNRTPAAADALVKAGAKLAASPRDAAQGAEFVITMVRDDAASLSVWCDPQTGAFAGMQPGAVAIESSTLSLDWIRELGAAATARGFAFLEAPVSGSRPAADAGQLVYLVGGEVAAVAKSEPVLRVMGAAVHHVGPVGTGALTKLATNTLLGIQVTTLAEIIGMLRRNQVDIAAALRAVGGTAVWAPIANFIAATMQAGDFRPQFPVELIEKDFGYTLAAAGGDARAPTIAAARGVFRQGMEQGIGEENMTSVVKLFTAK